MSEENVEIVQRFIDQARDNPDAVWSIFEEDVVWEQAREGKVCEIGRTRLCCGPGGGMR